MSASRGRRRKGEPPAYLHHRGKGQAYCTIGGQAVYLGPYGSHESRRRYREIVRKWEMDVDEGSRYSAGPGCTVFELVAAHAEHVKRHYRTPEGEATSEVKGNAQALRPLLEAAYADLRADEFRPTHLKAIREAWIQAGLSRKTVNQYTGRIRRMFRWAVGEELVSLETAGALSMVKDLAEGRTTAPDHEPITPVPLRDLAAVLRHDDTPSAVRDMIRLQLYCGARPGEVCRMTAEEIDREGIVHMKGRKVQLPGGVWVFQPGRHKARHKGRIVAYVLGARAQRILSLRPAVGWLFPSPRRLGRPWTLSGYQHSIRNACIAAGCGHWSPNMLRHSFLTRLDAAAGIQLASYAVGHASVDTTAIYVERNLFAVAEAVAKLG
jgi:integrase